VVGHPRLDEGEESVYIGVRGSGRADFILPDRLQVAEGTDSGRFDGCVNIILAVVIGRFPVLACSVVLITCRVSGDGVGCLIFNASDVFYSEPIP
jgi:hypothetical protein